MPAEQRYSLAISRRTPVDCSIRRRDHPRRPNAITCSRFPRLKTLPMPTEAICLRPLGNQQRAWPGEEHGSKGVRLFQRCFFEEGDHRNSRRGRGNLAAVIASDSLPLSDDPGSDSLHYARLLLLQQPQHSSLPTAASAAKPAPPSPHLNPVAPPLASSYVSSGIHSSSQN